MSETGKVAVAEIVAENDKEVGADGILGGDRWGSREEHKLNSGEALHRDAHAVG